MGRESRNEWQKCEDSNLNVAEPEPQQVGPEPQQEDSDSDSEPESDPLPQQADYEPVPAEPSDPEPGSEQQQVDEIPADLQVNTLHEDEIQQEQQVDPVPNQEHEDETVQGGLNLQVQAQQEVEPDSEDQEGVPPFLQESCGEEEETQTGDPPTYQESSKQGVETKAVGPSVSQESSVQEVEQRGTASISQECPESEVETQARVPPVSQEILQLTSQRQNIYIVPMIFPLFQPISEAVRREILEQTNRNNEPVPSAPRTSLEGAGSEISQQRHQIIVPMTSTLRPWGEILQQMNIILPIDFEFLQSSREEIQTEILFHILVSTFEQTRFMYFNLIDIDPEVIIHREFTAYHRIQILLLLFSIQFRTTPRLLPVVPLISLSALVASAPLLALRGLRHLLGLADIRNLPALEGPDLSVVEPTQQLSSLGHFPLLLFPESPPLSSSSEPRPNLSESEICSRLQKGKDNEQKLSELSSAHPSEADEVLAVCPRKPMKARAKRPRKRTESSKLGYADTTLHPFEYQELSDQQIEDPGEPQFSDPSELQKLLEYGNEDFSDPGEPDISDPIDLLKGLNFQEMKGGEEEMELTVNLELESIDGWETETERDLKTEASEDIETEVTDDGGDPNTEASGDLETEGSEDFKTKAKDDLEANDDEDLETSDDKDLEMNGEDVESDDDEGLEMENHTDVGVEECQLLLPNAAQLPHEDIIEIPDDAEEASSNASFPNDEGNSVSFRNETCCEGEAGHEELIEQAGGRCGNITILIYCFWIIFVAVVGINIYFALKHDRKGFDRKNQTGPKFDMHNKI